MNMLRTTLTSASLDDTARIARVIAAELRPRDVLLLTGDLVPIGTNR
jgi:tRNA A37 threonylcarbamoyladenosine biosynthesis protein TsaE